MRILLKLSGEALSGDKKTGFDEETVRKVALQVKEILDKGTEVGIVIGGGNVFVNLPHDSSANLFTACKEDSFFKGVRLELFKPETNDDNKTLRARHAAPYNQ